MTQTRIIIHGIGWTGISQAIRLSVQLGVTAILARLLTPNDFGLLAMVVVFTNFAFIFSDFGLTGALIQRKETVEEHLSSSFWINVLTGLILASIFALSAPIISNFYSEERLVLIITVLSSVFIISSFGIVQTALFIKELNFRPLAIIEIFAVSIAGLTAVILAYSGFGVWSLVWQQIISSSFMVTFLWIFSSWRPKFIFSWQKLKELLGFGANLTGFNFLNYFNRNLDNLLIGKFLGSISLGYYNLAYQLLLFPLSNISNVMGKVMFPSFSSIQEDKKKVRNAYINTNRYIALLTFPLMIGILIVAPQLIIVVFGPQWERSIFLAQILSLVGLVQSIGTTVGWIYQSQGRTDTLLKWGLFSTTIVGIAFIIGLQWDIEGVTIAYAIATLFLLYPSFAIPFRYIDLEFSYFIKQFRSIFLATISMGCIALTVRLFLENNLESSNLFILVSTIITGVISYACLLYIFDKSIYEETYNLLCQLKPSSNLDSE